jgi:hypothetical protein
MAAQRIALVCALAASLFFAPGGGGAAELALDLERAWAARGASKEALLAAIEAYEKASRRPDAGPPVFERLVRARYFLATFRLPDDSEEQREAYARALADGLRGLGRAWRKNDAAFGDAADLEDAAGAANSETIGVFYWTVLSYGNTISTMSVFRRPGAAKRFKRLVERALAIDERFFEGGPHRVLADYLAKAPGIMGGDAGEARAHAEAAVRLGPQYAENYVVRARDAWKPAGDRARYEADLRFAMALADEAAGADATPEQREAKEAAKRLLARIGEDF